MLDVVRELVSATAPATLSPVRRGYGPDLSPRERQVATLAATGRTNKEIARELYVQPDTVNKHLRSAMRKLEVRSRTALAHKLAYPANPAPPAQPGPGERTVG